MPPPQGNSRKGRGDDSSQANYSPHESYKDGFESPHKDARPRWRRLLTSRICWIITAIAMLLLGLVLGLSIGLTRSNGILPDNEPGAPQPPLPQPGQQLGAVVDLGYAKYQGDTYPGGISQWLGIRYAQPPVGDLRFAAPQSITGDGRLEMATERGHNCIGTRANEGTSPVFSGSENEDCLNLDVYAPGNVTSLSNLPVYFFIQGGGFNAAYPTQNGSALVTASGGNIIVVSINYRVSAYGFLASPEIQEHGSLNNGLKDQRMALLWVQDHIAKFGGNPDHVVIGGDSAGGASVALQLSAYGGRQDRLFHASVAESQSFGAIRTVTESQYQYDNLLNRTRCSSEITGNNDTLSCLRGLNITYLQTHNIPDPFPGQEVPPLFPYNPTYDHDFIRAYTLDLFNSGLYLKLPAIWGDVENEGTVFVSKKLMTSVDASNSFLQEQYPELNDTQLAIIQTLYPPENQDYSHIGASTGKYYRSTADAYGHQRYTCPGYFMNNITAFYKFKNPTAGNWNYHYNVSDPEDIAAGLGVPHVAEQSAIWAETSPASYKTTNKPIIALMQGYWLSFIMTLNPNTMAADGAPVWNDWGDTSAKGGNQLLINSPAQDGSYSTTINQLVPKKERDNCAQILAWGVAIKM